MQVVFKIVVSKICYGLKNVLGLLSIITQFAINIFGYDVLQMSLNGAILKKIIEWIKYIYAMKHFLLLL